MRITRRSLAFLLLGAGGVLLAGPAATRLRAQDQAPNRREFTIVAKEFQYSPARVEVMQDDLVKITVRSEDVPYSFAVDAYRIDKRVPAGGAITFEFQADRPGTFAFYSTLTSDPRHRSMRGDLVVRAK